NTTKSNPEDRISVTDIPFNFRAVGEMFLHTEIQHLEIVRLDCY
ncbi:glutamate racemase, partial [Francisella tularensis subsp. holarctica]|nr:glutamate racemase [Francisella tularensis subsp. holarctica]